MPGDAGRDTTRNADRDVTGDADRDVAGDADREVDVVVVGSGPGGAAIGHLLARSGVDVLLVERERDLERSFRGYLYQPFVLRMFDEMGLLDAILELEGDESRTPTLSVYGRTVAPFDFGRYDPPFDYALLMEQPPLLRLLIDRASEHPGFEYRNATTVQELVTEDDSVVGVHATDRDAGEDLTVRARVVVGADGRFSTVREAAGIDPGLFESSVELVWFKLPAETVTAEALGRVNDGGVLLYFGLGGGEAQLGYFVETGGYADLRSAGVEAFHDRVTAVDPSLSDAVAEHLPAFGDCSLLHIEPGLADRWVDDGLLLLGDAAHVASPVGGQGNGLAIADAVAAHPVICDGLEDPDDEGPIPAGTLARVERARRSTVERILRYQRRGERLVSALVRHRDRVPGTVRAGLLGGLATLAARSPLGQRAGDLFAWGSYEPVDRSRFVDR